MGPQPATSHFPKDLSRSWPSFGCLEQRQRRIRKLRKAKSLPGFAYIRKIPAEDVTPETKDSANGNTDPAGREDDISTRIKLKRCSKNDLIDSGILRNC